MIIKIHNFRGDLSGISAEPTTLVMWYPDIGIVLDDGRSTDDGRTEEQKKHGRYPPGFWSDYFWAHVNPKKAWDLNTEVHLLHVATFSCKAMQGVLNKNVFMADKQIRYLQKICSQAQAVSSNTRTSLHISDGADSECNSRSPLTNIEAKFNRILLVNFTPEQVVRTRVQLSCEYDVHAETIGHDDWATLSVSAGRPKELVGHSPQVLNQFLGNMGYKPSQALNPSSIVVPVYRRVRYFFQVSESE